MICEEPKQSAEQLKKGGFCSANRSFIIPREREKIKTKLTWRCSTFVFLIFRPEVHFGRRGSVRIIYR